MTRPPCRPTVAAAAAVATGMAGGALWAVAVVWVGHDLVLPVEPIRAVALAFLPPGLVLAAMIGRLAQRRFFDPSLIDGVPTTGAAEIDRRALVNTVEQVVLALCLWPPLAVLLGPRGAGVVIALGWAFVPARAAFWIGYHVSAPARAFDFAATFYPTVLARLWASWRPAATLIR